MLQPLLLALQNAGHDVGIACADTGASVKLAAKGFRMHDIPIERRIDWTSNWRTIQEITRILKEDGYDAVHVHTPVAAALGRVAAKRAGTKHIVYTAHGFYFHEKMGRVTYQLTYSVEKWLARFATDYLLLQSEEDYQLAQRKRFKANTRLMHLGNGIDLTASTHDHVKPERRLRSSSSVGSSKKGDSRTARCVRGRRLSHPGSPSRHRW